MEWAILAVCPVSGEVLEVEVPYPWDKETACGMVMDINRNGGEAVLVEMEE